MYNWQLAYSNLATAIDNLAMCYSDYNLKIRILSYSTKFNEWNTKSDIIVEAWMNLPNLYQG